MERTLVKSQVTGAASVVETECGSAVYHHLLGMDLLDPSISDHSEE